MGKTSLAAEYGHRFRHFYAGVWWCAAETRERLEASLAELAVELQVNPAGEAPGKKAAQAALRKLAEQRATWLLIYDNVDAPEVVADLLPAAGARVLITSRFTDWFGWAHEVALDALPIKEAATFLQRRAGRSDENGALTLAEALGGLPLALDHAGATCRRSGMSFADYSVKTAHMIETAPRGMHYPRSVAATFDLAMSEATTQSPAAEMAMTYLAFCPRERIPMRVAEGAVDDGVEFLEALSTLADVSLVKRGAFADGTLYLSMHPLVRSVAQGRAEARGAAQATWERILTRFKCMYPGLVGKPQSAEDLKEELSLAFEKYRDRMDGPLDDMLNYYEARGESPSKGLLDDIAKTIDRGTLIREAFASFFSMPPLYGYRARKP
jgi:hypothetical protein